MSSYIKRSNSHDPMAVKRRTLMPEADTDINASLHLSEACQKTRKEPDETIVAPNMLWDVFNALTDMIFIVNQDGIVKFVNTAAQNLFTEDIIGRSFHHISTIVEMIPFSVIKNVLTRSNSVYQLPGLHFRTSDSNLSMDFLARQLPQTNGRSIGYMYILKKTDKKKSVQKKRLRKTISIQEKERNRIALNLHDSLGHKIAASNFFINAAINSDKAVNTEYLLSKAKSVLHEAVREIRQICFDLMPRSIKDAGIEAALHDLVSIMKTNNSILFSLNIKITGKIPQRIELDLFRIVQELLSNAIKHGHPTAIDISLSESKERIELIFTDNGTGFKTTAKHEGHGLKNLKLRVASSFGNICVTSIPNIKTEFFIIIPLTKSPRKIHAN